MGALLLCVLLAAADAPRPAAAKPPGAATAAASDAQIEKEIKARLARSKIAAEGFQVRVQGGIATWEGKTSLVQRKGAATRIAKAAGARAVVNRIQVDDAARQKSAANLETGRRRAQIKRSESEKR
jgi:osmotically-inducible protein OsmY